MKKLRVVLVFILWMLVIPAAVYGLPMTQEDGDQIRQALSEAGVSGVHIDINVKIHVPKSENPHIPEGEEDANLWAAVIRPKESDHEKLPTILIASGYTRIPAALAALIIPHGYNLVVMDNRGTGSSGGSWPILDLAEQYDVKYVIDDWIPSQEWSDQKVGFIGMSYLSIIGSLAAGLVDRNEITGEPDHLKAMFILSMMSDPYQGAGGQGGNVNIELLSTWIGGTSMLSAIPPLLFLGEDEFSPNPEDIREAVEIWTTHIKQIPKSMGMIMDYENSFDGEFWDRRSAMAYWPIKPEEGWGFEEGNNCSIPSKLPIFTGAGWFDLFTRGVCNYYQYGLSNHSNADKAMIIGEWGHVGACSGMGLPAMETFELQFRWFDWKIKGEGKGDCFMKDFPVLLRVMGENRWRVEKSWPLPDSRVDSKTLYLSKAKAAPIEGDWFTNEPTNKIYSLVENLSQDDLSGDDPVLKHTATALHGMTSRSTQRWLYGGLMAYSHAMKFLYGKNIDDEVFWEDERDDDWKILTFTTEPLEEDLEIVGPVLLKFWAKTQFTFPLAQALIGQTVDLIKLTLGMETNMMLDIMNQKNVQWVVELNDVFPEGRARNITSGWLSASHRQYDPNEPGITVEHAIDPNYEPFDPFYTRPDKEPKLINEDELYEYAVELWPTCNVFKAGHRIRVTITGSDFPHLLPILKPSTNTIVIDENHKATLDFKSTNNDNEGDTYMWVGPSGYELDSTFNTYLLTDTDEPDPIVNIIPDSYDDSDRKDMADGNIISSTSPTDESSGNGCFVNTVKSSIFF